MGTAWLQLGSSLVPGHLQLIPLGSSLVLAWFQLGSRLVPDWFQLGSSLVPAWFQNVSTRPSLVPAWFQLGSSLVPCCLYLLVLVAGIRLRLRPRRTQQPSKAQKAELSRMLIPPCHQHVAATCFRNLCHAYVQQAHKHAGLLPAAHKSRPSFSGVTMWRRAHKGAQLNLVLDILRTLPWTRTKPNAWYN